MLAFRIILHISRNYLIFQQKIAMNILRILYEFISLPLNKYENLKIKKDDGFLEKPIIYVKCV